jgi:hypothetical protein
MLVQTIVLSRPTQHPPQIASVHVPDVVLGPSGYPIIDDGWESAVGLVSEPAAELIIIIMVATISIITTTITITIIITSIIIIAIVMIIIMAIMIIAMTLTITIVRMTFMIIIVVVAMVVAALLLPSCVHVWSMLTAAVVSHVTRGIGL